MVRLTLNYCAILAALFLTYGCTVNQPIKYDLKNIQKTQQPNLSNYTISVLAFQDHRKEELNNSILFSNGKEAKLADGRYCINSEEHYIKENVAKQISNAFAVHLDNKRMFKTVTFDNKENSDFYLTGKVYKYYGKQEFSYKSATASAFGLVGALTTMNVTTKGDIAILIKDLAIYDNHDSLIIKLDDINEYINSELKADPYCWQIYWSVNEQLKIAIEKNITNMEQKLSKAVSKHSAF